MTRALPADASSGTSAVPAWRHAARWVAHAVGTPVGRRHLRRITADLRDRVAGSPLRWRPLRPLGRLVHRRVVSGGRRRPESVHTFFLRNRPLVDEVAKLASTWPAGRALRVASIGCSTGAELYTALWAMRRQRPDLSISGIGVDIHPDLLNRAAAARYRRGDSELSMLSEDLIAELFEEDGGELVVTGWIAGGTTWQRVDVVQEDLRDSIGRCDLVLANNLLCHLTPAPAEAALRNIIRAVKPSGYLVCYGVDLDMRARVLREAGFTPVAYDMKPVYAAEPRALWKWPFAYWAQEPFDPDRSDSVPRYASIFAAMAGSP